MAWHKISTAMLIITAMLITTAMINQESPAVNPLKGSCGLHRTDPTAPFFSLPSPLTLR